MATELGCTKHIVETATRARLSPRLSRQPNAFDWKPQVLGFHAGSSDGSDLLCWTCAGTLANVANNILSDSAPLTVLYMFFDMVFEAVPPDENRHLGSMLEVLGEMELPYYHHYMYIGIQNRLLNAALQ